MLQSFYQSCADKTPGVLKVPAIEHNKEACGKMGKKGSLVSCKHVISVNLFILCQ